MSEPFLGEIRMFAGNFAPIGWALCNGQILAISENTALFAILGTTYGGDGVTTFWLPNLQGRMPKHAGTGAGLTPYTEGDAGGIENTTQVVSHDHALASNASLATTDAPAGAVPAGGGSYAQSTDGTELAPTATAGAGPAISVLNPYLVVNFIIALEGIFPSRN